MIWTATNNSNTKVLSQVINLSLEFRTIVNGSNMWHSNDEEESWKLTSSCTATSTESTPKRLTEDAYIESGTNKSFFMSIRPGVDKLVSVFPIVPISLGDLLGIFSGKIRFSEQMLSSPLWDLHCIFG
jgi:hypothetical protein